MRITGLATGLDIDEVVKDSMKPYRVKIQQQQQKKEIVEIKQKLYRDVLKDSRDFYNKYFDLSKSNSMLLTRNWTTNKFESSSDSVTVTAGNDAKVGNYTITGTAATAAKATITSGMENGDKIVINGKEFEIKGTTSKDKVTNLNNALKEANINVSVRYTDFASTSEGVNQTGFIFESTVLGKDSTFTIGGKVSEVAGTKLAAKEATAATIKSDDFTMDNLKTQGSIKIGNTTIDLEINDVLTDDDIIKDLNTKIKDKGVTASIKDGKIVFTANEKGSKVEDPKIEIGSFAGTFTAGTDETKNTNTVKLSDIEGKTITVNNQVIDLSKAEKGKEVDYIKDVLSEQGLNIDVEEKDGEIIFSSASKEIDISSIDNSDNSYVPVTAGRDGNIVIKDSKGGVYTKTGNVNSVTLDGITFKIDGEIPADGVKITGKQDVTAAKDMIVNFINDYNTLLEKLNTLTTTKRNRDYSPLTDEQKKEMSEDEIKLWNEKVEAGQLNKDSDINRIITNMKSAMNAIVDGTGVNLESIGIKPVSDYSGSKNGTFTVDEDKLINALKEDPEKVMNLFIKTSSSKTTSANQAYKSDAGVGQRLKSILYDETVTVSARLLKKAGFEGTSTVSNNELSKSITEYERKIKDMEKDFSTRAQALYSKYANIETMMHKLNSQQSYLSSMLGTSTS